VSADDRSSIVRTLHLLRDEMTTGGVADVDLPPDDELLDLRFPDGTHQMGVTRMSTSPRDGVVDGDCRVHGVANLYIASSAVFPVSGFEAPTLTIVALAARLADHLARAQRGGVAGVRDASSSS
jgi:choline dehydrogenase-like flavoprotein